MMGIPSARQLRFQPRPLSGKIRIERPGAPAPQLQVGGYGQVTPGLPNKVRSSPALSAEQTGNIPGEGVFTVLDGPVCAEGLQWWQVNYNGLIGWTADGSGSEYWVEPY